jgi:uncharacterized protein (DUF1800 family)
MAPDPKTLAAIALHRFGFGPRAGSLASVASDPRGAVLAELDRPGAGRIANSDLLTSGEAARAAFDYRQEKKAERLAQRAEREVARAEATTAAQVANAASRSAPNKDTPKSDMMKADHVPAPSADATQGNAPAKPKLGPGIPQQIYLEEGKVRFDSALNAEIGLVDRLTWFWSNHFCVSADKGQVRALCGAFEREAIRANVLGKFSEMLLAVESHPAMLLYLDNAGSIGPNSIAGQRRGKGINENLAREILELHTLGVRGGYSQDDVTNFAKIITGWTFSPFKRDPQHGGEFMFNERLHEPGPQRVLSHRYDDNGYEQGRAALLMLADHPSANFLNDHGIIQTALFANTAIPGAITTAFALSGANIGSGLFSFVSSPGVGFCGSFSFPCVNGSLQIEPIALLVVTPLPASLPLFATGLGALGLLGWRRKRKAAASIAA